MVNIKNDEHCSLTMMNVNDILLLINNYRCIMSNVVYAEVNRVVDHETGEIKQTVDNRVIRLPQEPEFIKLYLQDINKIFDLPKGCSPALYEILKKMNYEGHITLNKFIKEMCAKNAGLTLQSFNNCITDLIKKDIISRVGHGVYVANPNIFGKGSWADISKQREFYLTIKYSKNGKEIVQNQVQPELDLEENNGE